MTDKKHILLSVAIRTVNIHDTKAAIEILDSFIVVTVIKEKREKAGAMDQEDPTNSWHNRFRKLLNQIWVLIELTYGLILE